MDIQAIADYWRDRPGTVTGALRSLQEDRGYLEESAVAELARALGVPFSQLYGVATFFAAFRLHPVGKRHLQVCKGTACHVQGATQILSKLERELGVAEGEVTADGQFSLETVRCLGCCGLAPVVKVNDTVHGRLSQVRVRRLLRPSEEHHENTHEG